LRGALGNLAGPGESEGALPQTELMPAPSSDGAH
jgi:hypothetical protein